MSAEPPTITMPAVGTYADVAQYLKLAKATVYRMTHYKEFRRGIYLGRGRFNLARLRQCIEEDGTFIQEKRRCRN